MKLQASGASQYCARQRSSKTESKLLANKTFHSLFATSCNFTYDHAHTHTRTHTFAEISLANNRAKHARSFVAPQYILPLPCYAYKGGLGNKTRAHGTKKENSRDQGGERESEREGAQEKELFLDARYSETDRRAASSRTPRGYRQKEYLSSPRSPLARPSPFRRARASISRFATDAD